MTAPLFPTKREPKYFEVTFGPNLEISLPHQPAKSTLKRKTLTFQTPVKYFSGVSPAPFFR